MSKRRAMTREEWLSNPTSIAKWTDPIDIGPYDGPPLTLTSLLRLLKVEGDSFEVQKVAVDKWLESNEPTPPLRSWLGIKGFMPREKYE